MLTLAIQKKGRLAEKSITLLKQCGIHFVNSGHNKLMAPARNFPMQVLYLRDDDIPACVEDGIADIGIVGENEALEKMCDIIKIYELGFGKCRMSLAVPKEMTYSGLSSLEGKRIATSYKNILAQNLSKNGVKASIHEISGSVEIAPGINMADAIFDIVSTGSTLISNGLKEVETLLQSQACLYANKDLSKDKQEIVDKLIFRFNSVLTACDYKYILLNVPNDKIQAVCDILPGMKSPTIMPLKDSNWSSLHSVIKEDMFWDKIEQLKSLGAESLLVTDIEKMVL